MIDVENVERGVVVRVRQSNGELGWASICPGHEAGIVTMTRRWAFMYQAGGVVGMETMFPRINRRRLAIMRLLS